MKHTKTKLFALALALIMAFALAACSNGNSEIGFTGIDHANRPTNTPADTSNTPNPTTTQPPDTTKSLSDDNRLIGRWRAALSHYGFIYLYLYQDGDFIQEVRFNISSSGSMFITSWEESYKGSYSISDGTLSLTFKSAEHHDYGYAWESISLPANRTLTYTYGQLESKIFINLENGGLPPFDASVHLTDNQTTGDTPTLTTFYLTDDGDTVFGR